MGDRSPGPDPAISIAGPTRVDAGQEALFSPDVENLDSFPAVPEWSFDDGTTATGSDVAHLWQYPGLYRLSVVVPDGTGGVLALAEAVIEVTSSPANSPPAAAIAIDQTSGYAPLTVSFSPKGSADMDGAIANRAPVAVLSAEPASGIVPLTTTFSAEASYDPDGDPLNHAWSGSGLGGTDARFTHIFTEVGIHPVTLTVSDGSLSDSLTVNIVVQPEVTLPVVDLWVLEAEGIRSIGQAAIVEFVRQADDVSGSLTVSFAPAEESAAVEGVDFQLGDDTGELTFAPYEIRKTLSVVPLAVPEPTGPKPLQIEILPEDYYLTGPRSSTDLVIRDTDFSVDAGPDQTVAAGSPGGSGSVVLSGTSSDPAAVDQWIWMLESSGVELGSGQNLSVSLPVGGPYAIRLTGESDSLMEAVSDTTRVTVVEYGQFPAVAAVTDPGPVLAQNGRYAEVLLDGTPSTDPDGTVAAWNWYLDGSVIATGPVVKASLHVGLHELFLRVADNDGNITESVFTVEVLDATYEAYRIDFGPNAPASPGWNHLDRFHSGGIFDNLPPVEGRLWVHMAGPEGLSNRIPVVAMRVEEIKGYPLESHRLSLGTSNPDQVHLSGGGQVFPGDEVVIEAVVIDPDYRFVQWSDGNTSIQRPVVMSSDLSLIALLEPVNPSTGLTEWM